MTKINRLSIYHAGNQPVRVLQHNITKQFESTNPTFLELTKQIIAKNNLQVGISYYINELAIDENVDGHKQTPYVDANKKIAIHETFLSYVWSISYALLVLYDEAVAKPSQNNLAQRILNEIDTEKIEKAEELFKYAISLIKIFSPWDKNTLPNPELYDETDTFYIEKANAVFVFALNFILCHEFAHVEKEHFEKANSGLNTNTHILSYEKEADSRAIELMLLGAKIESEKTMHFGILVGICCLLFFKRETKTTTHPDTDDRIHSFLMRINPEIASPLWGLGAMAYKLWDNQFSKNFHWPKHIHDLKELYEYIRQQIKNEKNTSKFRK